MHISDQTMNVDCPTVQTRWMKWSDMQEVLAIENECFDQPWTESDFVRTLRQRDCVGIVAENGNGIVAYAVYRLGKRHVEILSIAVRRDSRRAGAGSRMIEWITKAAKRRPRRRLTLVIRETNLPAQLFFRQIGFRAVAMLHT